MLWKCIVFFNGFYRIYRVPGLFFSSVFFFWQTLGLFGRVISPSQGRYLNTRQHKHRINAYTDIHALSGIRTHDTSFRASEDSSCLRPRDHRERIVLQSNVGYVFSIISLFLKTKRRIMRSSCCVCVCVSTPNAWKQEQWSQKRPVCVSVYESPYHC
jgi:hypothetical protein